MSMDEIKETGFTLVELSMVLLIISLLLGGAFKVSSLIENAKIDRLINDLESFQTAYYAYYDRTGDFPGNGNQYDRFIDYDEVGVADGSFFTDLFAQGFIKSPEPRAPLDGVGVYFVTYLPASSSVGLSAGTVLGKNQACIRSIEKGHAKHLDYELDDGLWNTGTIRLEADFDSADTHTLCLEI